VPKVEFFFDCSSPWTYLAFHNIQPLARQHGFEIEWRPILVGGIFNSVNPTPYESRKNAVPLKQAYMLKDLADWARQAGLTIKFPPKIFPINSVKAMRGCLWLKPQGLLVPFATKIFDAYWGHEHDIADDQILGSICTQLGIDPQAFFAAIQQDEYKNALRANTDEAIRRGAFGSPSMFVGDNMYFGNDRLGLLVDAIKRQH
jgi:2-hydroxychromene-2-carboxylate isomerase